MRMDLNDLIKYFGNMSFNIKGVYHCKINPGRFGVQRSAPFPGFIFPLNGKAKFSFNDNPYIAGTGNIIHGSASSKLQKKVLGTDYWEFISILYDTKEIKTDISLSNVHFEVNTYNNIKLNEFLFKIYKEFNEKTLISEFRTETLFRNILEEIFISTQNNEIDKKNSSHLFNQVCSYIMDNYMNNISVKEICNKNNINENHLYYIFRKHINMGPGDYIIKIRLDKAKEFLINNNYPINVIAKNVGYPDALYFSRLFKKYYNISPTNYRKKFRNCPYDFQDIAIPI
ncbi:MULTISPECIES: helix-turn-helix domain-containing protein [Oceanotoga]|uniref:helix-turn-helix domain-containing protein n=1 Tax=Oceanotoga TaxID=1255275 RepID=UPI0026543A19|nr:MULTISPECIES: AraC family transcriptional regulator [Oceanotoga]MDN5342703.1 hypothetical protein [Oceanotoga sp.]MDO7976784.1 AraC family transcriptional regulator [Oceanotoga teriensis]